MNVRNCYRGIKDSACLYKKRTIYLSGDNMDQKDMLIIAHLRENSRKKLTQISRKTDISISTIFERMRKNDIIKKYTTILNFNKMGFMARTQIILKVHKNQRIELQKFLLKHESVNSMYKINNGYDFLVDGIFRHLKDAEDFVEILEDNFKIKSVKVFYIIDELKEEEFMSNTI